MFVDKAGAYLNGATNRLTATNMLAYYDTELIMALVTYGSKLDRLSLSVTFPPSLMFADKAGAYSNGATNRTLL